MYILGVVCCLTGLALLLLFSAVTDWTYNPDTALKVNDNTKRTRSSVVAHGGTYSVRTVTGGSSKHSILYQTPATSPQNGGQIECWLYYAHVADNHIGVATCIEEGATGMDYIGGRISYSSPTAILLGVYTCNNGGVSASTISVTYSTTAWVRMVFRWTPNGSYFDSQVDLYNSTGDLIGTHAYSVSKSLYTGTGVGMYQSMNGSSFTGYHDDFTYSVA